MKFVNLFVISLSIAINAQRDGQAESGGQQPLDLASTASNTTITSEQSPAPLDDRHGSGANQTELPQNHPLDQQNTSSTLTTSSSTSSSISTPTPISEQGPPQQNNTRQDKQKPKQEDFQFTAASTPTDAQQSGQQQQAAAAATQQLPAQQQQAKLQVSPAQPAAPNPPSPPSPPAADQSQGQQQQQVVDPATLGINQSSSGKPGNSPLILSQQDVSGSSAKLSIGSAALSILLGYAAYIL